MAEFDTLRIATVFTADAELDVRLGLAAFFDGDFNKLSNAGLIQRGKGVLLEDLVLGIGHQEAAHVITADAERGLCEVVGAEAEELRRLSDLISRECSTRHFNHGADEIIELHFFLAHHFFCNLMHDFDLKVEFFLEADERNHDLGLHLDLQFRNIGRSFKNRTGLHFGDLRIRDAETAAAMSEHRIELMECLNTRRDFLNGDAHLLRELSLRLRLMRHEFVERRIEETDRCRQTVEGLEDAGEVFALIRQQLGECGFPVSQVVGENHLTNGVDAVSFEEHVLRAGQADALRTERDGVFGLLGIVGVGPNLHAGGFRAPVHQLLETLEFLRRSGRIVTMQHAGDDFGRSGFEFTGVNDAAGAINGEEVALLESLAADGYGLLIIVDLQGSGSADADLAHLAGNECGVGRHPTASGQDAVRSDHAAKIFRTGLVADEKNLLASLFGDDCTIRIEVDLAGGSTWTSRKAGGDGLCLLHIREVEDGSEKLVELVGRIAHHGGLPVDELFLDHVHGELERGGSSALAVASLQHEQLAFLNGELNVLHILEVLFKSLTNLHQFGIRLRHFFL